MAILNYRILLGALGALVVTVTLAASSWAMPPERGMHPERMLERMTRKLDLTEQQQAEIGAVLEQSRGAMHGDMQRIRALRESLSAQRRNLDEGSLQATADEIGQLTSRMIVARTSSQAQIYAVLSPSQQDEMDKMLQKGHAKRHKRMPHEMF